VLFNSREGPNNRCLKRRSFDVEMFHKLGVDEIRDLLFVVLYHIDQLAVVQIAPEMREGLISELEQEVGLFVVVNLRMVDQFVDDNIVKLVRDNAASPDYCVGAVLLFPQLFISISSETG